MNKKRYFYRIVTVLLVFTLFSISIVSNIRLPMVYSTPACKSCKVLKDVSVVAFDKSIVEKAVNNIDFKILEKYLEKYGYVIAKEETKIFRAKVNLFKTSVESVIVTVPFVGTNPGNAAWITVYLNDKWSRAEAWIADTYSVRIYMVAASMKGKITYDRTSIQMSSSGCEGEPPMCENPPGPASCICDEVDPECVTEVCSMCGTECILCIYGETAECVMCFICAIYECASGATCCTHWHWECPNL